MRETMSERKTVCARARLKAEELARLEAEVFGP
jgi:hypothetical protein